MPRDALAFHQRDVRTLPDDGEDLATHDIDRTRAQLKTAAETQAIRSGFGIREQT